MAKEVLLVKLSLLCGWAQVASCSDLRRKLGGGRGMRLVLQGTPPPPLTPAHATPPFTPAHATPPFTPAHANPPFTPAHANPPFTPAHASTTAHTYTHTVTVTRRNKAHTWINSIFDLPGPGPPYAPFPGIPPLTTHPQHCMQVFGGRQQHDARARGGRAGGRAVDERDADAPSVCARGQHQDRACKVHHGQDMVSGAARRSTRRVALPRHPPPLAQPLHSPCTALARPLHSPCTALAA
eukprot:360020-Chlamydomonas_euryale.AAC.8